MEYREVRLDDGLLETLIEMSEEWEREDITFGYVKNSREDIEGKRIFLASENGETAGYLLAHEALMNNHRSIAPDGTPYLEIDELYVRAGRLIGGIGKGLFAAAERAAADSGLRLLLLHTSTKNYRAILHFYIDEVGMDFWSAALYKRIDA